MIDENTVTTGADQAPDYEKIRDEKCIPIARQVLKDLATDMIPQDANDKVDYNPVVNKILQVSIDNDLNITTEVSYISQLVLGALAGLNATVQKTKMKPIDDVRYGNISRKILEFVAESNITLGSVTPDQTEQEFAPIKDKIDALFEQEGLTYLEVKYVMDNIFSSYTAVNNAVSKSIEDASARAEAKLFGVDRMTDLTLKHLDEVLKA